MKYKKGRTKRGSRTRQRQYPYTLLTLITLSVISVILLVVILVLLFRQPALQIERIHVAKTDVLHEQDIGEKVQQVVSGAYLFGFPKDSWLLYPRKKIKRTLHTDFPRIKNIQLSVEKFATLNVIVSEWQPSYLWCDTQPRKQLQREEGLQSTVASTASVKISEEQSDETYVAPDYSSCQFMARNGYIFSEAPYFSEGVHPTWYVASDQIDEKLPENTEAVQRYFDELIPLIESIESKHPFHISSIGIESYGDVRLHVEKIKETGTPGALLFINTDVADKRVVENVGILLRHDSFIQQLNDPGKKLKYIDLRFEGQLLFKFE